MAAKKTTTPPIIKVGADKKSSSSSKTKRSVVVHKSSKAATDWYQVLAKTEETIQELSRMLAESMDSDHLNVRGMPRLTPKQEILKKQLDLANKRADAILKIVS